MVSNPQYFALKHYLDNAPYLKFIQLGAIFRAYGRWPRWFFLGVVLANWMKNKSESLLIICGKEMGISFAVRSNGSVPSKNSVNIDALFSKECV